jgi:formylglycine-generating enzyme required for sulfatase activity
VLADYLEEYDDPRRAELLRLHRRLLATCCEPNEHPERVTWQARIVELLGQGVKPCVPQRTILLADDIKMAFSFIPPGSFLMGSPKGEEGRSDDEVQHRVTLTKGYWLGVYPVTQAQWRALTGETPSKFKGNDLPVEQVSWNDCVAFCKQVGEACRLPTEAEWEYTCRSGTTTPFHLGETISTDQANYNGVSTYVDRQTTMPVGSFPPNPWGLYDMHGTIYEWCLDACVDVRSVPRIARIRGGHILRGGSWYNLSVDCRSAARYGDGEGGPDECLGCRILLDLN